MLDTSVLFSALAFDGNERLVLERVWLRHTLVVTDMIEAEMRAVMRKKLSPHKCRDAEQLFDALLASRAHLYYKTKNNYADFLNDALARIAKKDAPILAAGLQPEVHALVTGDADFLENRNLASLWTRKIFTSREILPLL
ncbi:MAG: PIN domain-containing protein [Candidatus Liptonbacteria bacterium]|nr:PIN domain-containing protein [Candidatus Liptonbacteria bacterium]